MTDDVSSFLAQSPVFRDVPLEQVREVAPLFRQARHPAGTIILRQGGHSDAVFFLRSGRLAVRVQRGDFRETVAYIQPPQVFGELSFLTGRPCVADVEVVVDADVVYLRKEDVPKLPKQREEILRGLTLAIAERLQETVTRGAKAPDSPIVLLRNHPRWEASRSFAAELASSLARQTGHETLLVSLGSAGPEAIRPLGPDTGASELAYPIAGRNLRAELAPKLGEWKSRFENVILNAPPSDGQRAADQVQEFANSRGDLLGPGDALPTETFPRHFAVQSAVRPSLPVLSGSQQLIRDAAQSESAYLSGQPVSAQFRRTVDSIARWLSGLQLGLALGGGAAWGWAHIGVLSVLEEAGVPIDVISGSSMGSVIGAFRAAGTTVEELREIAEYWRTRTLRFVEWRFWRMSLLNERVVRKVFHGYFGDRHVNQTEIPYWANAVDIKTGQEFAIQNGSLVDCIRASIAMPGLLPPVQDGSHLLLDAAIMDPVPVHLVRNMGCHYAVAVNAVAALESQHVRSRYPFNAFDIMTRCMLVMGHEIGQARAEQASDLVFTPTLGDISILQFDRSPEIIECGRKAAEIHLPAILAGYERLKARGAGARQRSLLEPPL